MRTDSVTELMPIKFVTKAVELQWRVFMLPWTTFLYWLSCVASLLMRFLVMTGSPPSDFPSRAKLKEVLNVVDHLHQREDNYRRKIKELQEEVEYQHKEKKKAIAKLHRLREELEGRGAANGERIFLHRRGDSNMGVGSRSLTRWGVHASVLLVTIAAFLFFEHKSPALSRKIVSSIIFPTWFLWMWSMSPSAPRAFSTALYCSSWFLLGFLFHIWLK